MARKITAGLVGGAQLGGLNATNNTISAAENTDIALDPLGTGVVRVDGDVRLTNQGVLRFGDTDNSNFTALRAAGTVAANVTFTLPTADGTSNQAIITDGSGNLSFNTLSANLGSNTSDSATNYIIFNAAATGFVTTPRSSTGLTFQPSTGTLTTTNLSVGGTIVSLRLENVYTSSTTLSLADSAKVVAMNNTSDATVTVPPNSSIAFPIGSVVYVARYNSGKVTLAAGAGVSLTRTGTFAANELITLRKRSENGWHVEQSPTTLVATSNTPASVDGYNVHTYNSSANFIV